MAVLYGILANLSTIALTISIIFLVYSVNRFRLLRKIIGLKPHDKNINIYLSSIYTDFSEEFAKNDKPISGYKGALINILEYKGSIMLSRKIRSNFYIGLPEGLGEYVRSRISRRGLIEVKIEMSQGIDAKRSLEKSDGPIICIGSHLYNSITKYIQDNEDCFFCLEGRGIPGLSSELQGKITRTGYNDRGFGSKSMERELCIVQKIHSKSLNKTILMLYGTTQEATLGAVEYFAINWKDIYRNFRGNEFGYLISFSCDDAIQKNFKNPTIEARIIPEGKVVEYGEPKIKKTKKEFFLMPFEEFVSAYAMISRGISSNSDICIEVKYRSLSLFFNPGEGFSKLSGNIIGEVPFEILRAIVFPNFTQFLTVDEFVNSDRLRDLFEENDKLKLWSCNNFIETYDASVEFFNSEDNELSEYFRRASPSWWGREVDVVAAHATYRSEIETRDSAKIFGSVLELGCGHGRFASIFAKSRKSTHVDISPSAISLAESLLADNSVCIIGDISRISELNIQDKFDLVFIIQVSMHLRDPFCLLSTIHDEYLSDGGEIWVDFTCLSGVDGWRQESFFTRIYSLEYVERRLSDLNLDVTDTFCSGEDNGKFWAFFVISKAG